MPITDLDRRRSRSSREERARHLDACHQNRVGPSDRRTTPPPIIDVTQLVPELRPLARTAVRLHPRFGDEPPTDASKLGGHFIWPAAEDWPVCADHGIPYVTVLQLRQEDFPATSFPPGKDLFQLLWCPLDHADWIEPVAFWRTRRDTVRWVSRCPLPEEAILDYVPVPCLIMPEEVVEFPCELQGSGRESLETRLADDSRVADAARQLFVSPYEPYDPAFALCHAALYYDYNLSVCPSAKVGGYVHWIQEPHVPVCRCGRKMDYFLTIVSWDYGGGDWHRWSPVEDRWRKDTAGAPTGCVEGIIDAPGLMFGDVGNLHIFVCRHCPHWPVQAVGQCG